MVALRLRRAPIAVVLVAAAAGGCSGPSDDDAAATVGLFYGALASGDGAGACALLLPAAASELELDTGEPCDEAVLDLAQAGGVLGGRAAAARVEEVHRAGGQAQVVTAGDTVFLALSGDRWVVTAVGCDARGDRPYECEVES